MKIALLQTPVKNDKASNLSRARESLLRAAEGGADLLALPEMFACPYDTSLFPSFAEEKGGEGQTMLSRAAKETGKYVVGGTLPEREGEKIYNTCFVYDPSGKEIAFHRKVRLFDVDIRGGPSFRESDVLSAGNGITLFDTPYGKIGICVCFDFRFARMADDMARAGAKYIVVPAAFNMTTGPAHWELLFRQRAVDCQVYTAGISPARNEKASYQAYGHSICCDPWGRVLAQAGYGEETLLVSTDPSYVDAVRAQLPVQAMV